MGTKSSTIKWNDIKYRFCRVQQRIYKFHTECCRGGYKKDRDKRWIRWNNIGNLQLHWEPFALGGEALRLFSSWGALPWSLPLKLSLHLTGKDLLVISIDQFLQQLVNNSAHRSRLAVSAIQIQAIRTSGVHSRVSGDGEHLLRRAPNLRNAICDEEIFSDRGCESPHLDRPQRIDNMLVTAFISPQNKGVCAPPARGPHLGL